MAFQVPESCAPPPTSPLAFAMAACVGHSKLPALAFEVLEDLGGLHDEGEHSEWLLELLVSVAHESYTSDRADVRYGPLFA